MYMCVYYMLVFVHVHVCTCIFFTPFAGRKSILLLMGDTKMSLIYPLLLIRSQYSVEMSTSVLDVYASQQIVAAILEASTLISEAVKPLSKLLPNSSSSAVHQSTELNTPVSKEMVTVSDELRAGSYRYNISHDPDASPSPGEIMFHEEGTPTMTWCCLHLRAVTKITVLPVPFIVRSHQPVRVSSYIMT